MCLSLAFVVFFFFNDTATTEIYTLSLHDALPIFQARVAGLGPRHRAPGPGARWRSEEHTSELQSHLNLVCRLLLEKKKTQPTHNLTSLVDSRTRRDYLRCCML